jgi:aspartate ammonia-lyase
MMADTRMEKDLLGERELPEDVLWGIQTARAIDHFGVSGRLVHPALIKAYALVKKAAALANKETGYLAADAADAIAITCDEIAAGGLADQFPVDALQGGAGTSTNMNLNEVIARRSALRTGLPIDAHDHVNLHQSTNDTYPTALKVAAMFGLQALEKSIIGLQEAAQRKEREFASVVKLGRTQLRDAVPTTLGREFGAYANALARDRWRVFKCLERLRAVNLGGTAIGTGIGAPRRYIFLVTEKLREITRLPLARAENLIDGTQNNDEFCEVSGIIRAHAANLVKIARDLRLMASGPKGGFGEIFLPALQPGSSIMPGKVNPVLPEMVMQAGFRVMAHDQEITLAVSSGELELNAFLPLVADALLSSLDIMQRADTLFARHCIDGIRADVERCRALMEQAQETVVALIPVIGHAAGVQLAQLMQSEQLGIRAAAGKLALLSEEQLDQLLSAEHVCALGFQSTGSPP